MQHRSIRALVVALSVVLVPFAKAAYPDKPIRIVVTAPPGGTIDYLVRAIAPGMSKELGQSVVVDNKGGASGLLGADLVAKAPADGYTVLLTDGAALAINAAVRKDMPFDMAKDLVPVSLVATTPSMLSAHPSFPAATVKELVAVARKDPKAMSYAHPGVGTPHHLAGIMLARTAGIEMTHVPYKGGGPMVADVVGGQVPLLITGTLATLPQAKAGKLKPLAIAARQRSPLLPDVPTFIESGFPDFEAEVFFSMFVPANAPADVVPTLARALSRALADVETRRKLEEQALTVVGSSADALRSHFQRESRKWGELIRSANIVLE
jgi:tripartite-type tricarboxylate transporter receptor subunit TctC